MSLTSATMKAAKEKWAKVFKELQRIDAQIAVLAVKKRKLIKELRSISQVHEVLGGKPLSLSPEQELRLKDNPTLGDVIEAVLRDRGPLDRNAIQSELEALGRLTSINARIILANAIKRDRQNRFKVENGKVSLKSEKEKRNE